MAFRFTGSDFRKRIAKKPVYPYSDLRVNGLEKLARAVHQVRPDCKVIAQLEVGYLDAGPSAIPTPFSDQPVRELSGGEIEQIIACFVEAIVDMRDCGFDGVQLHAAHGGLLSRFLSPYTNRRQDDFGGTEENRARVVGEIVARARRRVGDYPVLIKMNCTDYLVGGVDIENCLALAQEIVRAGVDAIELSGGMWECLFRPEEELGFRPVPAPEFAHPHPQTGAAELFPALCRNTRFAHPCDPGGGQPGCRKAGGDFTKWQSRFHCPVPPTDP